jgi:hypothetical protein
VNKRDIGSDLFPDKMSRNADPRSDGYRLDLQSPSTILRLPLRACKFAQPLSSLKFLSRPSSTLESLSKFSSARVMHASGVSSDLVKYNAKRAFDNDVTLDKNNRRLFSMLRFKGSLEELQKIVARCSIPGDWELHTKSNHYRFRASTGAILNRWPTTKALNFQGKEAESFKDLFLRHTLVEVEQPEPSLSCDESVWIDLPDPSPPFGAQGSARDKKHRKVPRSF